MSTRLPPWVEAPTGTHALIVANRLLIDLSWNSRRLEGNTCSLLETERLLSGGEMAEGKEAFDAQMILNHKEAIEFLIASASEIGFNRYTILNLHAYEIIKPFFLSGSILSLSY